MLNWNVPYLEAKNYEKCTIVLFSISYFSFYTNTCKVGKAKKIIKNPLGTKKKRNSNLFSLPTTITAMHIMENVFQRIMGGKKSLGL